jgi:REP element-mobilizing transposase RayT
MATGKIVRERRHRLDRSCYRGTLVVAITACLKDGSKVFVERQAFHTCESILKHCLLKTFCEAHVYVFMPDHCHFVIQGQSESADILACMKCFKQRSGFWLGQNRPGAQWQKDFYDHVLRKEEDLHKHINYVLANPVRKELVANWKHYPFKGSTIYDLEKWA